jgi:DNA mismatch repair protein MutS2
MDDKTLTLLEYPKILEKLAGYCDFSASAEMARLMRPTNDLVEARRRQAETSEAVRLLEATDLTIGGARDVRAPVDLALRGGVLDPSDLLDIKYTLVAARSLARSFERLGNSYPNLADIAAQLPPPLGLIESITRAISDRGEILDSASEKLSHIRRDLRIVHDRLMSKLQRMVADPRMTPYLQDALVTIRDGRYVLPLRAEFKGKMKAIIHDQSASGATLFVEPLGVVEQNNQYRELELAERDEVRRILAELSRQVADHAFEITHTVEVVAALDLALARGEYSLALRACEPLLRSIAQDEQPGAPPPDAPPTMIRLFRARHPLLDPEKVVAIDVELGLAYRDTLSGVEGSSAGDTAQAVPAATLPPFTLVITGPNTGGKTVTLKTVGLLTLMAQSGLHIPAENGSELSVFETIYADIGDEQSIEQSLSTFSGHITNIIRILDTADQRSMVILDELGAGTDPQEGAALARAILTHLVERRITTLVTTHHPELKAFAHSTPGAVNASVEFDLETLRPTYHLTIGLPGRSNALAIAQRLGMPQAIIGSARSELNPDDLRAEDLLDEIHHQRDRARIARQEAERARREADGLRRALTDRLERIEDERRKTLEEARQQGAEELEVLRQEMADLRRQLTRLRQPVEVIKEVQTRIETLEEKVEQPVERQERSLPRLASEAAAPRRIRLGDKVRLRGLGAPGVVSALTEDEAEVQMGALRIRTRLSELTLGEGTRPDLASNAFSGTRPVESAPAQEAKAKAAPVHKPVATGKFEPEQGGDAAKALYVASPGMELDLRGKRADEALEELERYLDAAYMSGLPFVRVIHGKGTGKLREVVRQALQGHPHVRSFESGSEKDGGEGVTVIKIAS